MIWLIKKVYWNVLFVIKDLIVIPLHFFQCFLPPNKPSMYIPSIKGNRLYIIGLINFVLTNGKDNKIWLEKKGGLKRDYRISIIIDSSK